jgi:hypothetical protein
MHGTEETHLMTRVFDTSKHCRLDFPP